MYDEMPDADLVRMARGQVPAHQQMALMQALYGRTRKYAEGGLVSFDWVTPQAAAQLLNRMPGTELPPGLTDDVLRKIVAGKNQQNKSALAKAGEAVSSAGSRPFEPSQSDMAENDRADRLRELRGNTALQQAKPEPAPRTNTLTRAAAAAEAPKDESRGEFDGKPPMRFSAQAPQRRAAPAPTPPRSPGRAVSTPEPDIQPPPMRPSVLEQAAEPAPEQPAAAPKGKEPPTWASPLMAAGFAMLASRSPNFGNALGEAGLAFMSQSQQEEMARRRAAREERQFGQADRQLNQQAELTREQIAARKDMAEETRRMREAEFAARNADRADARSIQQQRLGLDREEAGLRKRLVEMQIAQAGQKGDPSKLIYDTAADILAKNPMLSPPEATRMAIEMYGAVMNRGQAPAAPNPLGFPGGGGLSQGGQAPNPAGLLP